MRRAGASFVPLVLAVALSLAVPPLAIAQDGTPLAAPATPGPAGRHVDIGGGRNLYLDCAGAGSPTVVLEAASGNDSSTWAPIWSDLAGFT